ALGELYFFGEEGISNDYSEARRCFQIAAKQGRHDALNNLGVIYEQGLGVTKDLQASFGYYRQAAEKGNARAQMNLGRMYAEGSGVEADVVEGYKWLQIASQNNEAGAKRYIQELDSSIPGLTKGPRMTPAQVAEAMQRVQQFNGWGAKTNGGSAK